MSDEQLNTAIDEVARTMTEGSLAGDAGFRRRVLARIESGGAPRRSWRPAFVLSPIAVTAAILIAVTFFHRPGPEGPASQTPPIVVAIPPRTAVPGSSTSGRQDAPPAPARLAEAPAARRPFGPGVLSSAPRLDLNDVASIAVAPLGVDPLAPDPIPIERLETIVPLVIAPLDITDQRREP